MFVQSCLVLLLARLIYTNTFVSFVLVTTTPLAHVYSNDDKQQALLQPVPTTLTQAVVVAKPDDHIGPS
jgi:hypothetical protein